MKKPILFYLVWIVGIIVLAFFTIWMVFYIFPIEPWLTSTAHADPSIDALGLFLLLLKHLFLNIFIYLILIFSITFLILYKIARKKKIIKNPLIEWV
ncbi:MAG: hypothetical protein ACFFFB_02415 [Candidatus Heimdallarchaeota archaeon]